MSMRMRVLVALAVIFSPSSAFAEGLSPRIRSNPHRFDSPQHFAMEFRMGPYRPDVDGEPGLTSKPYNTVFGESKSLYIGGEFDWQAVRIPYVGTLGPGFSIGYMSNTTTAPFKTARTDGAASSSTTSLEVIPIHAIGVFRADVLWRDLQIPFVPYAKGGFAMARWRASGDNGTDGYNGVPSKGTVYGYHVAGGLMLSLNWIEPHTARNFDQTLGVNGTYLFFEVYTTSLTSSFKDQPLYAGTTSWTAGLAFEF